MHFSLVSCSFLPPMPKYLPSTVFWNTLTFPLCPNTFPAPYSGIPSPSLYAQIPSQHHILEYPQPMFQTKFHTQTEQNRQYYSSVYLNFYIFRCHIGSQKMLDRNGGRQLMNLTPQTATWSLCVPPAALLHSAHRLLS